MNVIAKISCYFERSVVTLKLRKEYLNTVTYNTPVLLRIKYWTILCQHIREFQTFKKQSGFLAHPVYKNWKCACLFAWQDTLCLTHDDSPRLAGSKCAGCKSIFLRHGYHVDTHSLCALRAPCVNVPRIGQRSGNDVTGQRWTESNASDFDWLQL